MRSRKCRLAHLILLGLLVGVPAVIFIPAAHLQQGGTMPAAASGGGLQIVTFNMEQGQLVLNLPDDMAPGDTISGTVVAHAHGRTDEERAKNQDHLKGLVVEIDGKRIEPFQVLATEDDAKRGSFVAFFLYHTEETKLNKAKVELKGAQGDKLGNIEIALMYKPLPSPSTAPAGAVMNPITTSFQFPQITQQGRPSVINGPFDGNSSNTVLNWNAVRGSIQDFEKQTENVSGGFGLIGRPLAESPRKAVFTAPSNVAGPIQLNLKEGAVETQAECRNVGVNLTAPKTSLLKGETTTVTVQVSGLQGITQELPLQLVKGGVVTMEGGDTQSLTIKPSEVSDTGIYTTARGITGQQAGAFSVTATVSVFDVCLQDTDRGSIIQFDSQTGDYKFLCEPGGLTLTGTGSVRRASCVITLEHNAPDRRVMAKLDFCSNTGNSTVQSPANKAFTITDKNTKDNTCTCPGLPGAQPPGAANASPPALNPQPSPSPGSPVVTSPAPPATGDQPARPQTTAGPLDDQVVHVESVPGGGNGLWTLRVKLPNGKIIRIFIRSEKKPDLKFCNWIRIKKSHDERTDTYVDSYELTTDPTKKPPPKVEGPKPVKPPDPPKTTGDRETTKDLPPCKEGQIRSKKEEKKSFEFMDDKDQVAFSMESTSAGGVSSALGLAAFWKTAAKIVSEITDRLPGAAPLPWDY